MRFNRRLERALKFSRDPKDWLILADFYADQIDVMETEYEKKEQEQLAECWRLVNRLANVLLPCLAELVTMGRELPNDVGYAFRCLDFSEYEINLKRTRRVVFVNINVLKLTESDTRILYTRSWHWKCRRVVYWPADTIEEYDWEHLVRNLYEMARFIKGKGS